MHSESIWNEFDNLGKAVEAAVVAESPVEQVE